MSIITYSAEELGLDEIECVRYRTFTSGCCAFPKYVVIDNQWVYGDVWLEYDVTTPLKETVNPKKIPVYHQRIVECQYCKKQYYQNYIEFYLKEGETLDASSQPPQG